jgi:aromatic-amino-acid transaminase
VVATVLTDPALRQGWETELEAMRSRILSMRAKLHAMLRAKMPERDFDLFLSQRGMFSYTRLSPAQVERLRQ